MGSLVEINKNLEEQNKSLETVSETLTTMLKEDIALRKEQERQAGQQEEDRREAKSQNRRASTSMKDRSFSQGLLGGGLAGLIGQGPGALGGLMAAIAGGLAFTGGRALKFGIGALVANKIAQGMVDKVSENIDLSKLGFEDEEAAKDEISKGINTAIGLRFLGLRGRLSLLAGIGVTFGDQITSFISDKINADVINAPNPLAAFGLGPDQFEINLNDPSVKTAVGGAVALVGGQLLMMASRSIVGLLGTMTVGATIALLRGMGISSAADLLEKARGKTLENRRAFDPNAKGPKVQTNIGGLGGAKVSNLDKPVSLSQFSDDLARMKGQRVGNLFMPEGPGARPLIQVPGGGTRFANLDEIADAVKKSGGKLDTVLKGLGKALLPLEAAYVTYMATTDEEKKQLGVGFGQRLREAIDAQVFSTVDFFATGTVGLFNKSINQLLEKAGVDYRFQTESNFAESLRETQIQNFIAAQKLKDQNFGNGQNITIGNFDNSTQNNVANSSGGKGSTGQFGSAIDQYYIEKLMMQQGVRPGHGPFGY